MLQIITKKYRKFTEFFENNGIQISANPSKILDNIIINYIPINMFSTIEFHQKVHSIFTKPPTSYLKISNKETEGIIKEFRNNNASGYDNLPFSLMKKINVIVSPIITNLINFFFKYNTFPRELKITKITPLIKNTSKKEYSNFRPIGVINFIEKIIDKIIYKRINQFTFQNDIISKS